MDRNQAKKQERFRTGFQLVFTALTNGYVKGFVDGKIFQGPSKEVCLPGLNCYSCPGALGSCPIGALQAVANDRNFTLPLYVWGFLIAVGAFFGRLVCGFMCPFGLVQDLLYKIPMPVKLRNIRADRWLRFLKYVILALFVLILPMFVVNDFGQGDPWFCKYICPSGTLMAGWPLAALNEGLRGTLGFLFAWKSVILIVLILLSMILYRPFCRYLCPLGAVYGLFNKVSLYRLRLDKGKCTGCGACESSCRLNIDPSKIPNSMECIRCGRCVESCPTGALRRGIK
ncbi:4Fe-4S binding protein [Anaerovorax odorimutans]|uniref:4Fe-4S binding protein n=1 Tax=Anaerovorax odorimutans TaxID=109327 RepID=A0ABT1RM75_9FIRM|nr:4Fe-4S binding protein [Anaerovorax odorimutans]MCQ4636041.1 4Fe-4S binding protein [Anaerovorax odorimutans]